VGVDKRDVRIENPRMGTAGSSRKQIAQALNAAYADGLISHDTLVHRLDRVLASGLIDPRRLIGDLGFPKVGRSWRRSVTGLWRTIVDRPSRSVTPEVQDAVLLALDWTGAIGELFIGRHPSCDVVLESQLVSRRHARLFFRDGSWIIQDLASTNGTLVNGAPVGRCKVRPGDELVLGTDRLRID
jgi:hypothetical protein